MATVQRSMALAMTVCETAADVTERELRFLLTAAKQEIERLRADLFVTHAILASALDEHDQAEGQLADDYMPNHWTHSARKILDGALPSAEDVRGILAPTDEQKAPEGECPHCGRPLGAGDHADDCRVWEAPFLTLIDD